MFIKNYYTLKDLYYSCLYGRGIYNCTGEMVSDPLCSGEGKTSPLLTNIFTGEKYFAKSLNSGSDMDAHYKELILKPPKFRCILWPSDMISITDEQVQDFGLHLSQSYTDKLVSDNTNKVKRALLFPYGGYPNMINGARKLRIFNGFNWKMDEIKNMAVQLMKAADELNRCGYFYNDIHFSRIFFSSDGRVLFNFSPLIRGFREYFSKKISCSPSLGEYPLEFAEPYYTNGFKKQLDFNSQNYSLCAMLFYIFFNRYPYDGRLLSGYVDDCDQNHYIKFRDYQKMSVFIFDPENRQNALGIFEEDQHVIALWNECPNSIKELFIRALKIIKSESRESINPPPLTWLRCFYELGWINKN